MIEILLDLAMLLNRGREGIWALLMVSSLALDHIEASVEGERLT